MPKELAESFPLDSDAEVTAIRTALKPLVDGGQLTIIEIPHLTGLKLQRMLHDERPHIVHYLGHGTLSGESGFLVFENDEGSRQDMSARQLGILFRGSSVRLVVLNAYKTSAVVTNLLRGIAPALMNANIPAVVGMQSSVQDDAGLAFVEEFYRSLVGGTAIDDCVAKGRKAVIACGLNNLDWGLATLYMRLPDGVLFDGLDVQDAVASASAPTESTRAPQPSTGANINFGSANQFNVGSMVIGDTGGINIHGRNDINQPSTTTHVGSAPLSSPGPRLPPAEQTSQSSLQRIITLSPKQRIELAKLLLECMTMQNPGGRAQVIGALKPAIRNAAPNNGAALMEMVGLLKICENHSDGIQNLIEELRNYEGDSIPMRQVDAFLATL
jgi:hypothetical protein